MASGRGVGGGRRRKPRRGSRAKGKKTKYLSLSDLIKVEVETTPPEDGPAPPWEEAEVKQEDGGDEGDHHQQQQMEAFTLFAAAPSLTDILGASAGGGGDSPSASPDCSRGTGFLGDDEEEEDLARRALRGRERWVYCCSSCSSPTTTTTTATASSFPCSSAASTGASERSLLLKLDYEEILAAWADRGSLYIGGGANGHATPPAPEPELDNVLVDVGPSQHAAAACAWSSPKTAGSGRAERVRRYKENRLNRLFVKRIRYEVRQVNAVKRPRFKGRFIKKNEECELQPT